MARQSPGNPGSVTFKGSLKGTEAPIAERWDDDGLKLTAGEANVIYGQPIKYYDPQDREHMRMIREED